VPAKDVASVLDLLLKCTQEGSDGVAREIIAEPSVAGMLSPCKSLSVLLSTCSTEGTSPDALRAATRLAKSLPERELQVSAARAALHAMCSACQSFDEDVILDVVLTLDEVAEHEDTHALVLWGLAKGSQFGLRVACAAASCFGGSAGARLHVLKHLLDKLKVGAQDVTAMLEDSASQSFIVNTLAGEHHGADTQELWARISVLAMTATDLGRASLRILVAAHTSSTDSLHRREAIGSILFVVLVRHICLDDRSMSSLAGAVALRLASMDVNGLRTILEDMNPERRSLVEEALRNAASNSSKAESKSNLNF